MGTSTVDVGRLRAFRHASDTQTMTDLGVLPGTTQSDAFAVSRDGSVVVGESYGPHYPGYERAFRWTSATGMVDLGFPDSVVGGLAVDTNADGSVVVLNDYHGRGSFENPMIWDEAHGTRFVSEILIAAGDDPAQRVPPFRLGSRRYGPPSTMDGDRARVGSLAAHPHGSTIPLAWLPPIHPNRSRCLGSWRHGNQLPTGSVPLPPRYRGSSGRAAWPFRRRGCVQPSQ
ncbi:MAG: hypothetical protein JW751_28610 [Polyangiaceae bacterium]|nr:hypothetical protein [Polyangiaceae bacterium]